MNIEARQGDIAEIAPQIAEAAALWIRDGFTGSCSTWLHKIVPNWHPVLDDAHHPKPWNRPKDSVIALRVPDSDLKYAYIFSHPRSNGYASKEELRYAIRRCLNELSRLHMKRIAFMHMPFSNRPDPLEDNVRSASAMVSALREWEQDQASNPITDVYLVDHSDGFVHVLQNEA